MNDWLDLGPEVFPGTSGADVHASNSIFWGRTSKPHHGNNYITLVAREDETYELIAQQLSDPLLKDSCYNFSVFLSQALNYRSNTKHSRSIKNFDTPCVLRILGTNDLNEKLELLAESEPVDNPTWQEYQFSVSPSSNYSYVILCVYYETPIFAAYNGNICIDLASDFKSVSCSSKIAASDNQFIKINPGVKIDLEQLKSYNNQSQADLIVRPAATKSKDEENKLLVKLYTEGRNYGLYRFVQSLSDSELIPLFASLENNDLNTEYLTAAVALKKKIKEEGHSEATSLEIEKFENIIEWHDELKNYLLENGIVF